MNAPRTPHVSGRARVNSCAVIGATVGVVVGCFQPWQLAVLAGWVTVCAVLLAWIWFEVAGCDAAHTQERATREDTTRVMAVGVMVVASIMSLAAVAFGLAKARHVADTLQVVLTAMSVLSVLLSWCAVHSMFTLRYAHLYYSDPLGGLTFPGGDQPDYGDFAYFAFTVGMAFATSDVPIESSAIRKVALRHALVSYLFGAVIIGLTINVMAGFVR